MGHIAKLNFYDNPLTLIHIRQNGPFIYIFNQ
jgi:hypothetical protein